MAILSTEDLEGAFASGAVGAAYDDCGHELPPIWCNTEALKAEWLRGLASGYRDCDHLTDERP